MMTAQRNKAQRETRAGRLEKCRAERPTSAGPAVAGSRSRWLLCDYTTSIRTLLTNYLNTFKGDIPHKLRYPSRLALSGISIGRIPARRGRIQTALSGAIPIAAAIEGSRIDYFFSYGLGKHANMPTYADVRK